MNFKRMLVVPLVLLSLLGGKINGAAGDKTFKFSTTKKGYSTKLNTIQFSVGFLWEVDKNIKVEISNKATLSKDDLLNPTLTVEYKF